MPSDSSGLQYGNPIVLKSTKNGSYAGSIYQKSPKSYISTSSNQLVFNKTNYNQFKFIRWTPPPKPKISRPTKPGKPGKPGKPPNDFPTDSDLPKLNDNYIKFFDKVNICIYGTDENLIAYIINDGDKPVSKSNPNTVFFASKKELDLYKNSTENDKFPCSTDFYILPNISNISNIIANTTRVSYNMDISLSTSDILDTPYGVWGNRVLRTDADVDADGNYTVNFNNGTDSPQTFLLKNYNDIPIMNTSSDSNSNSTILSCPKCSILPFDLGISVTIEDIIKLWESKSSDNKYGVNIGFSEKIDVGCIPNLGCTPKICPQVCTLAIPEMCVDEYCTEAYCIDPCFGAFGGCRVCFPKVCTPAFCTPRVDEVCTPEIGCIPSICQPDICGTAEISLKASLELTYDYLSQLQNIISYSLANTGGNTQEQLGYYIQISNISFGLKSGEGFQFSQSILGEKIIDFGFNVPHIKLPPITFYCRASVATNGQQSIECGGCIKPWDGSIGISETLNIPSIGKIGFKGYLSNPVVSICSAYGLKSKQLLFTSGFKIELQVPLLPIVSIQLVLNIPIPIPAPAPI